LFRHLKSIIDQGVKEDEVLPYVEIVDPCEKINGVCRDPQDDMFLSCAIAAQADVIVSGDLEGKG
jgi:putative PIN family toxin of toxin-antitoxin system